MLLFPIDIELPAKQWSHDDMRKFMHSLPIDHEYVLQYKDTNGGAWCMLATMFTYKEAKESCFGYRTDKSDTIKYEWRIAKVCKYLADGCTCPAVREIVNF